MSEHEIISAAAASAGNFGHILGRSPDRRRPWQPGNLDELAYLVRRMDELIKMEYGHDLSGEPVPPDYRPEPRCPNPGD